MGSEIETQQGFNEKEKEGSRTGSIHRFGLLAIAGLMACCGWTIYSQILGTDVHPPAVDEPPAATTSVLAKSDRILTFEERLAVLTEPTFEERFAATTPPATSPRTVPPALALPLASDTLQSAALEPADVTPAPSARPASAPRARKPARKPVSTSENPEPVAVQAEEPTIFERLFSGLKASPLLAYAPSDPRVTGMEEKIPLAGPQHYDRLTAVYDISAKAVYLPNGTKLEAHSGLGDKMDDPRFVHLRMRGATPPHVYNLSLREKPFHGVQAIRLTPVGGKSAIHGRTGLLAHTYLLGPRGDSNGCVSLRNYEAFLSAYRSGEIKRLAVVARLN